MNTSESKKYDPRYKRLFPLSFQGIYEGMGVTDESAL